MGRGDRKPSAERRPSAGQDEADIVQELGAAPADPNNPTGELVVSEAAAKEAGAVDAESIRANRIADDVVNRKRGGEPNITLNEPLLQKYETVTRMWPVNTIAILVKRLTGTQVEWTITSQPKNSIELYNAIKQLHGRHEEATYEVAFRDSYQKQRRGTGTITLPDTREEPMPQQPQPGAPMNPYYPPQTYAAPPPGYAQPQQPYAPQPGYPPPQQGAPQPGQPVVQPTPTVQVMPQDPGAMMAVMGQMFDMFRQVQASVQPPQQPQQPAQQPQMMMPPPPTQNDPASMMAWMQQMFTMFQQVQASGQHPHAPQQPMMPQPPMQNDPASMMAWMQQMFDFFQRMQTSAQPAPTHSGRSRSADPQQQYQQPMNPMMAAMGMPPTPAPPGMTWVPLFGWVPTDRLFSAVSGQPMDRQPGPGYRGGYGPRGPYQGAGPGAGYPQGDGQQPPPYAPGYGPHPQQGAPQQPRSMRDQFHEAASVIRFATEIADEFRGDPAPTAATPAQPEEDDSPVRVIDAGPAKLVINRSDGSARYWETGWANLDKVLKFVGEQREAIQKAASDREASKRQPPQQLPPGFVEVTPGYVPPPGMGIVPIDRLPPAPVGYPPAPQPAQVMPAQGLPAPPEQMPPPLTQPQGRPIETPPDPRRTWTLPGT